MRRSFVLIALLILASSPLAQYRGGRMHPPVARPRMAESAIKLAVQEFEPARKAFDQDLELLRHVQRADDALVESIQPSVAIQKAYEEIGAAQRLAIELDVVQGLLRTQQQLEASRRSPAAADLERLRAVVRADALPPARRVVIQNATGIQEETLEWIKVQQMIGDHLRTLAQVSSDSLLTAEK